METAIKTVTEKIRKNLVKERETKKKGQAEEQHRA